MGTERKKKLHKTKDQKRQTRNEGDGHMKKIEPALCWMPLNALTASAVRLLCWRKFRRKACDLPTIPNQGTHTKKITTFRRSQSTYLLQLKCRRHRGRYGIHVQCPLHEKPFFAPCEIPRTPVGVSKHLVYHVGSSFINEYLKILKPDENQKSWNAPQRVFGENGRSSYSHLKLTFRLLLCAWIIACSWNQRGALWRQSWLLSCSLWSLSFFFRMKMFSGKTEMNMQKARSQASHMALCFKSWGLIFTDPHLAPSRQSRQNLPNNWILPPRLWVSLPGLPSPYTHVPSRTVQVIWIQETYWAS